MGNENEELEGGTGEEGSEGTGNEGTQGAGGAGDQNVDDDAFYAQLEKQPVKAVPVDRFRRVYNERKEHMAWRKEHEPKYGELNKNYTTLQGQMKFLGERISKVPYLRKAIEELLDSQDGSMNHQALAAAVQEEIKRLQDGGAAKKSEVSPELQKIMAEHQSLRNEIQSQKIEVELEKAFNQLPAMMKTEKLKAVFEGVEADDEFLGEVEEQLIANQARGKADPDDIMGSVLTAAQQVSKRWQGYSSRILGKQAGSAGLKAGAATMKPSGPSGKPQSKVPNAQKDPDAFLKYVSNLAGEAMEETKKER